MRRILLLKNAERALKNEAAAVNIAAAALKIQNVESKNRNAAF